MKSLEVYFVEGFASHIAKQLVGLEPGPLKDTDFDAVVGLSS